VLVAAAFGGACTEGDGTGGGPPATSSTAPSNTSTTGPATTVPAVSSTTPAADPAVNPVTLRVTGFTLPDLRAGGTGLRVVVRASSGSLRVRRRGAGGAVAVCPVAGATAPVAPGDCADLGAGATVDVGFTGGVELRATGAGAAVEEVGVTYAPVDRSTTVVTPARPAGACAAQPCQATFSLSPARPGPFVLDGRAGGGRPRLVLVSTPLGGGPTRTLATVEGGGSLSIRGTLEGGAEATLLHHEQGEGAVAPVTAELSWP
jgi:hypothetical protein